MLRRGFLSTVFGGLFGAIFGSSRSARTGEFCVTAPPGTTRVIVRVPDVGNHVRVLPMIMLEKDEGLTFECEIDRVTTVGFPLELADGEKNFIQFYDFVELPDLPWPESCSP